MAKEWAKAFYNGKKWKRCKEDYKAKRIRIDGGVCEECREEQGYIVHHNIVLNEENIMNPDIALNHKYLKYVCKCCHDQYEGHGVGHKRRKLCVSLMKMDNQSLCER